MANIITAYEISIGFQGALEAVAASHFCSANCRDEWAKNVSGQYTFGEDTDGELIDGEVCETCGKPFETDVLRSTVNTPEMHDTVLFDAREEFDRVTLNAFYEHGQWWIEDTETGEQWAVVDCVSQMGEEYFGYEQVSEGDVER